jgi:hypothetical protein
VRCRAGCRRESQDLERKPCSRRRVELSYDHVMKLLPAMSGHLSVVAFVAAAALVACGGSSPAPAVSPQPAASSMEAATSAPAAPAAGATAGPAPAQGDVGRSREDIAAAVASKRDAARACYDEGLKRAPKLEGDLDIKWTIDPEGRVTEVAHDTTKSTILDAGVADCVIGIIKTLRFGKSQKGYESRTHYPFNFHPKLSQIPPVSAPMKTPAK